MSSEEESISASGIRVMAETPFLPIHIIVVAANCKVTSTRADAGKLHQRVSGAYVVNSHRQSTIPTSCPTDNNRLSIRYSRIWNRKRITRVTAKGISNKEKMRNGFSISIPLPVAPKMKDIA